MKQRISHTFTLRTAKAFQAACTGAAAMLLNSALEKNDITRAYAAQHLLKLAFRIDAATELCDGCELSIDQKTGKVIETLYNAGALKHIDVGPTALAIINDFYGLKTKKTTHRQQVRKSFNRY